jgi:hypothetical protein
VQKTAVGSHPSLHNGSKLIRRQMPFIFFIFQAFQNYPRSVDIASFGLLPI